MCLIAKQWYKSPKIVKKVVSGKSVTEVGQVVKPILAVVAETV